MLATKFGNYDIEIRRVTNGDAEVRVRVLGAWRDTILPQAQVQQLKQLLTLPPPKQLQSKFSLWDITLTTTAAGGGTVRSQAKPFPAKVTNVAPAQVAEIKALLANWWP